MDLNKVLTQMSVKQTQLEILKRESSHNQTSLESIYRNKNNELKRIRKTALLESKHKIEAHDKI